VNAEAGQLLFDVGAFGEQRRLLCQSIFRDRAGQKLVQFFAQLLMVVSERLRTQLLYLRGGPFDIRELARQTRSQFASFALAGFVQLIDAIAPFTVETGTAAAFFTTPEAPDINQPTIEYVTRYVPDSSGKKLEPHVTVGVAPPDYLKKMVAEPFDAFTFSPEALSVYQLGNFGTARKKLEAWELKP